MTRLVTMNDSRRNDVGAYSPYGQGPREVTLYGGGVVSLTKKVLFVKIFFIKKYCYTVMKAFLKAEDAYKYS